MNSIKNLKKALNSYKNLSIFHRSFISARYFMVPWNKIIEKIGYSGKILDLGSGHALFLNLLNRERPSLFCYGFEPDKEKVSAIKDSLQKTNIKIISNEELNNLVSDSFDYVAIVDVLYCVSPENWKSILDLAYKILKPNGLFIVKETDNKPKLKYLFCLLQEFIAIKILRFTKGSNPKLLGSDYYLKAFRNSGFKVIDHYPINKWYPWPHHLFILRK